MKHVPKSIPEPVCLTSFRNATPQASWDDFSNTTCYANVRAQIRINQGGLCAYCERSLSEHDQQIAHFHPKSDTESGVNWALIWSNLWLGCRGGDQSWMQNRDEFLHPAAENRSCDVAKDDDVVDGVVLAPNEVPSFPRIFRYEQHVDRMCIFPDEDNCSETTVSVTKAESTIRVFNLNCQRISESRLRVHRQIENQVKRLRASGQPLGRFYPSLVNHYLAKTADGEWRTYFTMIRWRFGKTAEEYLQSIQYQG